MVHFTKRADTKNTLYYIFDKSIVAKIGDRVYHQFLPQYFYKLPYCSVGQELEMVHCMKTVDTKNIVQHFWAKRINLLSTIFATVLL